MFLNGLALRQEARLIQNKLSLPNRIEAHTNNSAVSVSVHERKSLSVTGRGWSLSGDLSQRSSHLQ